MGIIHADLALHLPDFRASERTFQLITQVAGRAGRGDIEGEVFVQSFARPFTRPFNMRAATISTASTRRKLNFASN